MLKEDYLLETKSESDGTSRWDPVVAFKVLPLSSRIAKLHTVSLVCGEKKSGFVEFRRIKLEFTGSDLIFDPSTVSTLSPSYSRNRGVAKAKYSNNTTSGSGSKDWKIF
ncbi:hypothetical protein PV325_006812 [Microctonus aethiopoides]|nr:hypothetical protein PV325_006812 [Microctonus aethiopoides]